MVQFGLPTQSVGSLTPAGPCGRPGGDPGSGASGLCVLVAEDNPTNQFIARRMLETMGHCVHVASNGVEAVEAARRHSFDAILMDILMPEMDGLAASRAIRAQDGGHDVPIVAISANAEEHDREACRDAGINLFLGKPFNRARLTAVLAEATATAPGAAPG